MIAMIKPGERNEKYVKDLKPGEFARIRDACGDVHLRGRIGLATFSVFFLLDDPKIDWNRSNCTIEVVPLPAGTEVTLISEDVYR